MELKEAREKLMALEAREAAYQHAAGLIFYDGATTAPAGTAENRSLTLAVLSEEIYKMGTSEETVGLLEFLDAHREQLDEKERRIVFLELKGIRFMQKIPLKEYVAWEELLVKADEVWHRAKAADDFPLFEPLLKEIFDTQKRFAGYQDTDKDAYDYWLNEYEEGLDKKTCEDFFGRLKARLVPLIKAVGEAEQVDDSMLWGHFDTARQAELAVWLMKLQGLDLDHVGLATTEHPFTTSLGSHLDERITTHYMEDNFASSMFSVIHEGGHALYDTGSPREFARTTLDGGVSMGIHESQSRFYENIIGRSRAYASYVFPKLRELFPEQLAGHTEEGFYRAINKVTPSLIRTEADEVTYALHIMVRYELEKAVMAGDLSVHDLPGEWNRLYKEYLGIDVPNDREGVLQDSHWSGGSIGYFPSYALGSAYGAQFLALMEKDIDVAGDVAKGDFSRINEWNRSRIWQYGGLYPPRQLLDKAFGGPFDPGYFLDYLEKKYSAIYGL